MEYVTISFDVDTTNADAKLGFEFWLDSQLIIDIDHVAGPQHISHRMLDNDGEHQLKIVLKNKKPEHTSIDEQGNIVQDACLIVKNVKFDDIELGHMFTELAKYYHSYNSDQPQIVENFYEQMGCNGHVCLDFATPVYLWLLENM